MRKHLLFISTLTLLIFSTPGHASDKCEHAVSSAIMNVDQVYLPKIDLWIKVAKALTDKGLDPRKYPIVMPDGTVEVMDLYDVIDKLSKQRAEAYRQIKVGEDDCEKAIKPYQDILNVAVFFSTGGLSAVLPPALTKIDASQILSGYPLGPSGALIPKMREDILNGLGIGGDVACFIRDPLRAARGGC